MRPSLWAEYNVFLPRTPWVRPKSKIFIPKPDDWHLRPFHMRLSLVISTSALDATLSCRYVKIAANWGLPSPVVLALWQSIPTFVAAFCAENLTARSPAWLFPLFPVLFPTLFPALPWKLPARFPHLQVRWDCCHFVSTFTAVSATPGPCLASLARSIEVLFMASQVYSSVSSNSKSLDPVVWRGVSVWNSVYNIHVSTATYCSCSAIVWYDVVEVILRGQGSPLLVFSRRLTPSLLSHRWSSGYWRLPMEPLCFVIS